MPYVCAGRCFGTIQAAELTAFVRVVEEGCEAGHLVCMFDWRLILQGYCVGNDEVLAFLELNGLKRIVRAHEYTGTGCRVVNLGYR